MNSSNVVLIGMPGAGKSTVGVLLAKRLGLDFIDSDLVIQSRAGKRLQEIIAVEGMASFRGLEEGVLVELGGRRRTVIATGGSAVYSGPAMAALERGGRIVFIDVPLAELAVRIGDMDRRGLVIDPGETLADLYARRLPLYRRYAQYSLDADGLSAEAAAAGIAALLAG